MDLTPEEVRVLEVVKAELWVQYAELLKDARAEGYRAGREEAIKEFLNSVTAYQVGHTVYDPQDVIIVRREG